MEQKGTWLITGCTSGLGKALALRALRSGHRVIATGRSLQAMEDLAVTGGDQCRLLELDVTAPDLEEKVTEAETVFGAIDVLVNNAGYGLIGAVEEGTLDEVRANFETNFFGALRLVRAVLPGMRERGRGHIVNISAAAAISNYPGFSAYGASKAALESASEALRQEVAGAGIRVMLVEPGPFRTDFIGRSMQRTSNTIPGYEGSSGRFHTMLKQMDGKQVGDPDRAAEVIVNLVESGHRGLRVPLGRYAVKKVRDRSTQVLREVEQVEAQAVATDF